MARADYRGTRLSLVLWTNVLSFVSAAGISVGDLQGRSLTPITHLKLLLGCLERWGIIWFDQKGTEPAKYSRTQIGSKLGSRRDGWGSGRGITLKWIVHLTRKGELATSVWPPLWDEIEERWKSRFGKDLIDDLSHSLRNITENFEKELPLGLPRGLDSPSGESYTPKQTKKVEDLPLSALLSQALLQFAIDYNEKSDAPLSLCANMIRVLSREDYARVNELPLLTGGSSETSDLGWQLKRYVEVKDDPSGKRGKVIRLSPIGLKAQQEYYRVTAEIERSWEKRFGTDAVHALHSSLETLLDKRDENGLTIRLGLIPPEGVARAGVLVPALGRLEIGSAARQRTRDLVSQTKLFLENPTLLPHYPLWDANRGFGP